jgi:RNA methyltransferase, TrmH family
MMKRIVSRHNALVARFRAAAHNDDRTLVLLDGPHLVAEAIAAGMSIEHAIVSSGEVNRPDISSLIVTLEKRGADVAEATSAVMAAVSPVRSASAIVAVAARPSDRPTSMFAGSDALVAVACGVQDPGNVGAIVRVAEAASASGLVVTGPSADPFAWKALRGSMGSALRLPIAVEPDPNTVVAQARAHGCRLVAAVPRDGQPLFGAMLNGPIAIVVGSEGAGVSPAFVAAADVRITIPMAPPVESLNTAVSAALMLYEAMRQRR